MSNIIDNILLNTDSYKASHSVQYPPEMRGLSAYVSARGSDIKNSDLVFFGLQYILERYLSKPFTQQDIDEAATFFAAHGEPFPKDVFQYILEKYNGFFPVTIHALKEGSLVKPHVPMVRVECTDPKCASIVSYLEPLLLRVWYPITVATISRSIKQVIWNALQQTSDSPEQEIPFKLHDFGARGASSAETSGIGGMAHLVNFMGSDTVMGAIFANRFYSSGPDYMPAYSIPAAEHSTITSWGREREVEAYRNMLKQFAKPGALLAVVSDSYDVFNAVENIWGGELKTEVVNSGATLVVRPDSGDPCTVVMKCLELLAEKFGTTTNTKGYRVLNNVRLIQGDGVNETSITEILTAMTAAGYSASNIAFGMGGALLQGVNRDTCKFAYKSSAMLVDSGEWVGFGKDPITDPGKRSFFGRTSTDDMVLVYENGKLWFPQSFAAVRVRAELK